MNESNNREISYKTVAVETLAEGISRIAHNDGDYTTSIQG